MPVSSSPLGSGPSANRGRFVPTPGGVAAEVGSFNGPMDVSQIGNIGDYTGQGNGSNPTVSGTPAPAPKTTPGGNPFSGLGDKIGGLLQGTLKPFQETANYIKSIPAPKVDTGRFNAEFVDPVKSFLSTIIGESPRPTPNPNAYEQYLQGQQPSAQEYTNPSMQPVVQPPSILEEMKKRRQRLFPQPIQSYPFGR